MIALNHLIVPARDKWASARFLAGILGIEAGPVWGRFVQVRAANGVALDFADAEHFEPHHYAFLVNDQEFDVSLRRLELAGVAIYAGPNKERPGEVNTLYGGRGVYFEDPDRHLMELTTVEYGSDREFQAWMERAHSSA